MVNGLDSGERKEISWKPHFNPLQGISKYRTYVLFSRQNCFFPSLWNQGNGARFISQGVLRPFQVGIACCSIFFFSMCVPLDEVEEKGRKSGGQFFTPPTYLIQWLHKREKEVRKKANLPRIFPLCWLLFFSLNSGIVRDGASWGFEPMTSVFYEPYSRPETSSECRLKIGIRQITGKYIRNSPQTHTREVTWMHAAALCRIYTQPPT